MNKLIGVGNTLVKKKSITVVTAKFFQLLLLVYNLKLGLLSGILCKSCLLIGNLILPLIINSQ